MTLLPDREVATVEAWLNQHQEIGILARDRGGGYGEATARALPHAMQITDRWHLMENVITGDVNGDAVADLEIDLRNFTNLANLTEIDFIR